jgi:CRISPR/Cas system CMR subunit Cmr6 (Cas7 group RAMP superfamily)
MTMSQKVMKFKVSVVRDTLKKNLEIHEKEYKELVAKNNAHMQEALQEALSEIAAGKEINLSKVHKAEHAKPKNYAKEYKKVISMLEVTTQDELELTVDEFNCYMNDDWNWKDSFISNKTMYGMS